MKLKVVILGSDVKTNVLTFENYNKNVELDLSKLEEISDQNELMLEINGIGNSDYDNILYMKEQIEEENLEYYNDMFGECVIDDLLKEQCTLFLPCNFWDNIEIIDNFGETVLSVLTSQGLIFGQKLSIFGEDDLNKYLWQNYMLPDTDVFY